MSALTTPTQTNKREKKKKRNERKETPTGDRKPNKGKEQDHLKKTSLGPLRQGQRLDTSETKQNSRKEHNPPNQSSTNHKELPLHTWKLALSQCNSPWTNACKTPLENRAAASAQLSPVRPVTTTGQTGAQHVHRTSTLTGQTGDLDRSDRCTPEPRNGSKPPKNLLSASSEPFQAQTSPPCWQCMNQAKNAKPFNLELIK
jgi:hypothetical protein